MCACVSLICSFSSVKYYQQTRKITKSCLISFFFSFECTYMFNLFLWEQFLVDSLNEIKTRPRFFLIECCFLLFLLFVTCMYCFCNWLFFCVICFLRLDYCLSTRWKKRILRKKNKIHKYENFKTFFFQYGTWRVTSSNTFICSVSWNFFFFSFWLFNPMIE